jgi:hypothetical protein
VRLKSEIKKNHKIILIKRKKRKKYFSMASGDQKKPSKKRKHVNISSKTSHGPGPLRKCLEEAKK